MTPAAFNDMQEKCKRKWIEVFLERSGLTHDDEFIKFAQAAIEAYMHLEIRHVQEMYLLDTIPRWRPGGKILKP